MGWDEFRAKHYNRGRIDRKAEVDGSLTYFKYEDVPEGEIAKCIESNIVVKSRMVGSTYYGAIEIVRLKDGVKTDEVVGVVVPTRVDGSYIAIKVMDESMGPFYYDCPRSIIKLLTPTTNENALEWRKKCIEKADTKLKLSKLDIGTIISFPSPFSTTSGIKKGDIVQLRKYGKTHWQLKGLGWGWRQNNIPDNFTIEAAM